MIIPFQRMVGNKNYAMKASTMPAAKTFTPFFGAVVGDIAGSVYERWNCKSEQDCIIFRADAHFTDDSVLTLATSNHLLKPQTSSYASVYQQFGQKYPDAGYGGSFIRWMQSPHNLPYNSWGNGSAMRASPIAWTATNLESAIQEAKHSAEVTHNHPEGIKGAQAVVAAVYLARIGKSKHEIKSYIVEHFHYDLNRTLSEIRPHYEFDVSCQGSVPEALIAFLESNDFEDAIRKAISLGGDSDTIACIAGSVAHAYYGAIPAAWVQFCRDALDRPLLEINDSFWEMVPN